MSLFELCLLAASLALDAMIVSAALATSGRQRLRSLLLVAFLFGLFQAGMPLIGYVIGRSLSGVFASVGLWIAFVLLVGVGVRMIYEATHHDMKEEIGERHRYQLDSIWMLLSLSLATSIDALVVGMSFAFISISLFSAVFAIGAITAGLSLLGIQLGMMMKKRFGDSIEIVGGVVLILIACKIVFLS